jgi:hypothetical protein
MNTNHNKPIAWIALVLTIIGLTSPFLVVSFASDEQATGFGLVCVIIVLILGVISWRHLPGKIAAIISLIALVLFGIAYMRFIKMRDEILKKAEQTQIKYKEVEQVGAGDAEEAV